VDVCNSGRILHGSGSTVVILVGCCDSGSAFVILVGFSGIRGRRL
jgi:hypothetical protein